MTTACFHGHDDIVQLLIEHNAQLNIKSGYGWTALHYVRAGRLAVGLGVSVWSHADERRRGCGRQYPTHPLTHPPTHSFTN